MSASILENRDLILGVEETWDSYYEVLVRFIKEITIGVYTYHLFEAKETKEIFWVRPRYEGHQIEGIFGEGQIVVNLFRADIKTSQVKEEKQPKYYATGLLQLNKT